MILEKLFSLKSMLESDPNVTIENWEIGAPASIEEIENFKSRLSERWGSIPNSVVRFYSTLNGFNMKWSNSRGLTGHIDIKPLRDIHTYDAWYSYPDPMGERENFFIIDLFSPETVAGLFMEESEDEMIDTIYLLHKGDEIGDETGLTIEEYLLKVVSAFGLEYESRQIILEPQYVYDELDYEPPSWPFKNINDFTNFKEEKKSNKT